MKHFFGQTDYEIWSDEMFSPTPQSSILVCPGSNSEESRAHAASTVTSDVNLQHDTFLVTSLPFSVFNYSTVKLAKISVKVEIFPLP